MVNFHHRNEGDNAAQEEANELLESPPENKKEREQFKSSFKKISEMRKSNGGNGNSLESPGDGEWPQHPGADDWQPTSGNFTSEKNPTYTTTT